MEPRDADVNGRESGSETEASFVLVDVRSVYVKKSVNPRGISKGRAGGERRLRWEVANPPRTNEAIKMIFTVGQSFLGGAVCSNTGVHRGRRA